MRKIATDIKGRLRGCKATKQNAFTAIRNVFLSYQILSLQLFGQFCFLVFGRLILG